MEQEQRNCNGHGWSRRYLEVYFSAEIMATQMACLKLPKCASGLGSAGYTAHIGDFQHSFAGGFFRRARGSFHCMLLSFTVKVLNYKFSFKFTCLAFK